MVISNKIESTDKAYCREVADLLASHGVKHCIICPGSRNAPLVVALHRHPGLSCHSVIDERSAAFIALGLASIGRSPVAIVCTSGSAVLNFAPAVAEAYYRHAPLIVISADRPDEWIDQDDSQTIRQPGILANIVKKSVNVQVELPEESKRAAAQAWHVNRIVNDCLIEALALPQGPVHINVQLDAPLGRTVRQIFDADFARKITVVSPSGLMPTEKVRALATELAPPCKVMFLVGFMPPDEKLTYAFRRLSTLPNVVVLTEIQSNVHGSPNIIDKIDLTLTSLSAEMLKILTPDVVITMGGSLVSRKVKEWLRKTRIKHWHIGMQPWSVDCFMQLDKRIIMTPRNLLYALESAMKRQTNSTHYQDDWGQIWERKKDKAEEAADNFAMHAPWSDLKAMYLMMGRIPTTWNLQLSNGTAVRYAQMFARRDLHRVDCNRGVSGIDGSASTAIGAAMAYSGITLLIIGDMSMQYDISALASTLVTPRLKIAVLNNGGGGIFRCVPSTRELDELDEYFACRTNLPMRDLARAYGFAYFEADNSTAFFSAWSGFTKEKARPAILNLITDPKISAKVLHQIIPL